MWRILLTWNLRNLLVHDYDLYALQRIKSIKIGQGICCPGVLNWAINIYPISNNPICSTKLNMAAGASVIARNFCQKIIRQKSNVISKCIDTAWSNRRRNIQSYNILRTFAGVIWYEMYREGVMMKSDIF